MKVLAISAGSAGGNTELVLNTALQELQTIIPSADITLIRLKELVVGDVTVAGQIPHPFMQDETTTPDQAQAQAPKVADDRPFVLEHILEADVIFFGAPLYSRSPSWFIKWFQDRTLGPKQDIDLARRMMAQGKEHLVDRRIFKPRVGALLSVGGALGTEWTSFGLPVLNQICFSLGIKVIDQMQVYGAGLPGVIMLDEPALARAKLLGRNLAQQAQSPTDQRSYAGDPGMCPICHLNMIVFQSLNDNKIDCATCGAKGTAVADGNGKINLVFDQEGIDFSVFTLKGLEKHGDEVGLVAARLKSQMGQVLPLKEDLLQQCSGWVASPPSHVTQ